ncbi:hypothetical protein RhiJN_18140 [Ceratobasidium sp. AG-Ba]|nr:hypothetical protein RhiJN_18140 [Ceratobasidium sp. AG-Ba]
MSKRLASFGGPSVPSSAPVSGQSNDTTPTKPKPGAKNKNKKRDATPSSPSSNSREPKSPLSKAGISSPSLGSRSSTYAPPSFLYPTVPPSESLLQLYLRTVLKRIADDLVSWNDLASRKAFTCAKALVDKTTELDNALSVLPEGVQPRSRILGPRLRELDSKREELRGCLVDFDVFFTKVAERAEGLETALAKLTERDGQESTEQKPVWSDSSWSFSRYVSHVLELLRQLNRTRSAYNAASAQLVSYSLSLPDPDTSYSKTKTSPLTFSQARTALASWSSETSRTAEYMDEWKDISSIEAPWDEYELENEESEDDFDIEGL